jgi:hypothetical protein
MRATLIVLSLLVALGLGRNEASASWIHVPTARLAAQSDLIVVGRLGPVQDWRIGNVVYKIGTIVVDSVLWGPRPVVAGVPFRWRFWQDSENLPFDSWVRVPAVWLLQKSDGPYFTADYPDRVLAIKNLGAMQSVVVELKADTLHAEQKTALELYLEGLVVAKPARRPE